MLFKPICHFNLQVILIVKKKTSNGLILIFYNLCGNHNYMQFSTLVGIIKLHILLKFEWNLLGWFWDIPPFKIIMVYFNFSSKNFLNQHFYRDKQSICFVWVLKTFILTQSIIENGSEANLIHRQPFLFL